MKRSTEIPELTRISSKGQIVIPARLRKRMKIKEGSVFAISAKKDMIIMKRLDTKMSAKDIKTLKLLEESWKDIEKGRYKTHSKESFFKELKKW